jgi:hypothetical protein
MLFRERVASTKYDINLFILSKLSYIIVLKGAIHMYQRNRGILNRDNGPCGSMS